VVLTGLIAALLTVVTACSGGIDGTGYRLGAAVAGTPVPDPVQYVDCTSEILRLGVQVPGALRDKVRFGCAHLQVPLDYSRPHGQMITLAMVRVHDTDNHDVPVQSLLVNPGGPGASGVNLALGILGKLSPQVLQHYDLVGFDPRGVAESGALRCLSDQEKDRISAASPDLRTRAGVQQSAALSRQYARACDRAIGPSLRYYNTVNTARDMDQIRQAVGDDVMNYLGFSYGTELGWTYAHLFPKQVHTFVLDGAVDPQSRNVQDPQTQLKGFESAYGQFAAWCRKSQPCAQLGNPVAAAVAILAGARNRPLTTSLAGRTLTESLASTGIAEAMYSRSEWSTLAEALVAARRGDGTDLLRLADRYNQRQPDGHYSNLIDANSVISCNDAPLRKPPSTAHVVAVAKAWGKRYPIFGADMAGTLLGCTGWQRHRVPIPSPAAATPKPVLVVGNLHDPATPYQGAVHLTKDLGNARLLSWNGEGHTSYLSGSNCIDSAVNAYLIRGALPPDHEVCPAK
jgi:pimeloyl-ACP methyl ester carboxylesterase